MNNKTIGREEQRKILEQMTPEQRLDTLEKESRNLAELDPEGTVRYFITSFRRKYKHDPQRDTETS